ncbi:MAG: tetratricopeptide repeat protein [Prevotellaceae bacterium]|jgi:tetratricopeptide (TPR) repeat protein|nr:tetratricopeptide repeat protein [Prevotellaceae bacterium]
MKAAEKYFEEGNKFYDEQDYDKAIDCFQKAIELNPYYAEAYKRLGNVYFDIQDYDKVIEYNKKAITLKPDYEAAYFNTGLAYRNKQDYDKSIEYFQKVIELNPDDANAYLNIGDAYFQKQDDDKTIEFWQKAIDLSPHNPNNDKMYFAIGCLYLDGQKFEEAVENFDKAVAINIDYKDAWYFRGIALMQDEKLDDAIKSFDHALIIDPEDKDCLFNKALAMSEVARCEDAIGSFDKALAIDPNDAKIWNSRGVTMSRLHKWKEALENNDKALEINPNSAEIWKNRGLFFWGLKMLDEAIESFDKAININPLFEQSWCWKGYVFIDLEKYDKANECFDKALEINPNMYQAGEGRIILLQTLGRYAEAAVVGAPLILMGLANNKEMRRYTWEGVTGGDKTDLEYYKRMAKNEPNNECWLIEIGNVYANLGNYDKAIEYYNQASENDSDLLNKLNRIPLYRVKQLLDKQDIDKAFEELEKSKKYMRSNTKQIETIDVVHFFAKTIKEELKNDMVETPFLDFTIEFIKTKDEYFRKIINAENRNKNKYANMYMLSLLIVDLLHIKDENVAHYTTPIVTKSLLFLDEEINKVSLFRLNDAKKSNDEMEGITLLKYLFDEEEKYDIDSNNITFIGCFTFDSNNLNQFRLYGKVDELEATGISVEVSSDYFEGDNTQLIALPDNEKVEHIRKRKPYDRKKLSLYRCIYLDPVSGVVEDVGHIAEAAAKRGEKRYDKTILENVKAEVKELLEKLKNDVIGLDKSKTIALLENLNALVKYYGYKDEQECRVVKILSVSDSKIKTNDKDIQYIEYLPMNEYLQRITLSPKSIDEQLYKDLLRKSHINAKVEVSKHPFRNK